MSRIIKHKIILYKLKNNDIVGEPNNGKYEMPKFEIEVSNIYVVTHVIEADDEDHAIQIADEVSELMETKMPDLFESELKAKPTDKTEITYEPYQKHLK